MEKRRMPEEWYKIIRQAKLKRADVSKMIGIAPARLSNIYSRLIYIDDDIYYKLKKIVDSISGVMEHTKDKSTFVGRIVKIICINCKKPFDPWGSDDDVPYCVCRGCNSNGAVNNGNI